MKGDAMRGLHRRGSWNILEEADMNLDTACGILSLYRCMTYTIFLAISLISSFEINFWISGNRM
jgi:hypothetical protein